MERGKIIKPSAILTGDWHLREDTPVCYIGNFEEDQWNVVLFIKRLQEQYDCPVLSAGDLFHHWKPSPYLLTRTMKYLPKQFYTIYGQHDLPQHNLDLAIKSGVNTLMEAGLINVLDCCHFGQEPENPSLVIDDKKILVWHHLTYITEPYPGATGGNAEMILKKYSQFDLIVCGDNHCSFTIEKSGRRLVNTGNITRQTASQIDFKPCVFLWYAETNTVQQVFLPIVEGVISREHLEVKEQRNERIDAFVAKLGGDYKTELSFEQNLSIFFQMNEVDEEVKQIIYKSIDGNIN